MNQYQTNLKLNHHYLSYTIQSFKKTIAFTRMDNQSILKQMAMVRGNLKTAKYKKDVRAGNVKMRKLERQLKKL